MSRKNGGIIGPVNTPVGGLTTGVAGGVWRMNDVLNFVNNNQWPKTPQNIENSCRFNDGSTDYLNKTFSSAGNRKTFTFSLWLKRSALNSSGNFGLTRWNASDAERANIQFENDSLLIQMVSGSSFQYNSGATTRKFRDVSAWYHIVLAVDTTDATQADRVKLYVNGVQETLSPSTNIAQNTDTNFNNSGLCQIGAGYGSGAVINPYDGYIAEVVFVDGQQLDPTSFGEFDSATGIWKPKKIGRQFGSVGTNGFYLDFKDSSNFGKDQSGLGNDFTVNNLTSIDQTTDTCVDNFATLNPLATNTNTSSSNFSEGNLELDRPGATSTWVGCVNTMGVTQGKWYAEYKVIDAGDPTNGVMIGVTNVNLSDFQSGGNDLQQSGEYGINYYAGGEILNDGSTVATYTAMSDGDIVMIALDIDNGKIYWGRNGTWENSGDPESGATGTGAQNLSEITTGDTYCFNLACREDGNVQANYGNPPFSISSGNSDGNGYGNFEYAVPSGYYALNTSNLNTYG